jgi:hypothetical protein
MRYTGTDMYCRGRFPAPLSTGTGDLFSPGDGDAGSLGMPE